MHIDDLDYELPDELIAQEPAARRDDARMLVLDRAKDAVSHAGVRDLPAHLRAGDLLVLNDTRVLPARVYTMRSTGGRVELLFLEPQGEGWLALARSGGRLQAGEPLTVDNATLRLSARHAGGRWLVTCDGDVERVMAEHGRMPLPPYIRRDVDDGRAAMDAERYQTLYAAHEGAVAAPTAGLHLTPAVFDALSAEGVERAFVTLHVGLGTFEPVRSERLEDHDMHMERYAVAPETADAVRRTKARGGRVVAVGTTSVRALEAAALAAPDGLPLPGWGHTDLLIAPGFTFQVVDALLTNFHLPKSTLMALVSAFAGRERILDAYRAAVAERYRFYSYGDAMLLL